MEPMFSNGMCRCCASEGTYKDLSSKYRWMGVDEVYADMLRECFDVTLVTPEDSTEGGICEVCITQLRNAANFKKQVLNTEEQFKRMLQNKPYKSDIVKVEVSPPDDELRLTDEDNNLSNDDFSSTEYEVPIKTESSEEGGKSRKRSAKAGPSRSKHAKLEGETSSKRNTSEKDVGISFVNNVIKLMNSAEVKQEPQNDESNTVRENSEIIEALKPRFVRKKSDNDGVSKKPKFVKRKEIDKHLHNLWEILLNTNATPIRTYNGIAYTCCFCYDTSFTDLRDLKTHTLLTHNDTDKKGFMKNYPISAYVVKLDVSGLQCIICLENITTLENMMKHLTTSHEKSLHMDIKNHILPFRFEEGVFSCVLCPKKIEHFKVMQEHLNVHYGSYYCKVCSAPFMTQRNMMSHMKRHKQGEFVCKVCSKIFDTSAKRDDHEKFVHDGVNKRNKCPICCEKFMTHYRRQEHMVREHGVEQTFYKCMACDKSFVCKSSLTKHKRRDHLFERRHECRQCDKKFFSLRELNHHMLSHTGVKAFQCDVCLKSYGRKHTLREHLRIHEEDRRFKCELCEQAFVQKCSWKSHMRSKHGIVVNNN